jgi:5-methylcytosine-specific restriction endonuclease McrA
MPSTIADHVKDHRGDIKLFFDPNNVRGVCKPCHDRKTGSMHGGGDRTPPAPAPVENGVVANQGQTIPTPTLDDAVDYMKLLKRQQR